MKKKIMAVVLVLMFCLAMVLYKHLKKIIVIQFLLAIMAFALFVPKVYVYLQQTHEWIELPDSIESSVFKKHPNVYFIQPDGYANFSELKKGYYKFDNALFETYLSDKKFTFYNGFRSNYTSTIFTNSAIFSMKHHYYRYPRDIDINSYDFRNIIVGNNPVLSIFKANDYKTHLLLQQPYFLLNRPKMGYDYCNIDYNDIPYFSHGFDMNLDVNSELEMLINQNSKSHNFYVLEKILPSHIAHSDGDSNGIEEERELYLNRLKEANEWLTNTIEIITSNDPDGLIVICADHGGFVGLKCMDNSSVKTDDRDILHSVFTSVLAIKWPDNHTPDYTDELKTSVNLFRVLVSYLSENETYLNYLEDDKSFSIIDTGAPLGVYEVLDEAGHTAFNRSVE
ncbi:hypothetical protein [Psychroserpens algicola]|uniref:Sulfatase N-terminal domain-containing protein n=1 Tax=Psychroserpens algicola TaxID=1719034 RepID=A0ABT0H6X8_9FLAO|nr:hypothetical protein [Psychroserpens algicola]MCK8480134.1 hypothetical protein [Psychroserpens algicola]